MSLAPKPKKTRRALARVINKSANWALQAANAIDSTKDCDQENQAPVDESSIQKETKDLTSEVSNSEAATAENTEDTSAPASESEPPQLHLPANEATAQAKESTSQDDQLDSQTASNDQPLPETTLDAASFDSAQTTPKVLDLRDKDELSIHPGFTTTEGFGAPNSGFSRVLGADPLTRCVSREAFVSGLADSLYALRSHNGAVGVIVVDIDQFTTLNNSLGPAIGDQVLVAVADRLRDAVRPHDVIARLGSDEFVMMCRTGPDPTAISEVANRIHRHFDTHIETDAGSVRITVSIGTAAATSAESASHEATALVHQAEAAVHRAKNRGRSQHVAFDPDSQQLTIARYRTEQELRSAVHNEDLMVNYQPIVNLHSGEIVALEALARWNHPDSGPISPALFIPIAEESGLIDDLGSWVLSETLRQSEDWSRMGHPHAMVTINVSSRQLADPHFVPKVRDILHASSCDPRRICLEITESVIMNDVAASMALLSDLKNLGLCLAIDDFGTGYSSLSYLRRLPVDILKIDKSFVQALNRREDRVITKAIIDLAHTLGMTTIGEGVESRSQVEMLYTLDCDMAQGFLLHFPSPAGEIDFSRIRFEDKPDYVEAPLPVNMTNKDLLLSFED